MFNTLFLTDMATRVVYRSKEYAYCNKTKTRNSAEICFKYFNKLLASRYKNIANTKPFQHEAKRSQLKLISHFLFKIRIGNRLLEKQALHIHKRDRKKLFSHHEQDNWILSIRPHFKDTKPYKILLNNLL